MAKFIPDSLVGEQLHGKLDGYVVRRFRGKSVLQRQPQRRQPWSRRQRARRELFAQAAKYASVIRLCPLLRQRYEKKHRAKRPNYWQAAISDYLHPPKRVTLVSAQYSAAAGGALVLSADETYDIIGMKVVVRDRNGVVLAHGDATYDASRWRFPLAPASPGQNPPTSFVVTAFDRPGNFVIGTFTPTRL